MTKIPIALCRNSTLDFQGIARSHHRVGNLWKVASIAFAVATAIFLTWMIAAQFGSSIAALEVVLLLGSFGGLGSFISHLLWKGGLDELSQSSFYSQVHKKTVYLQANWGREQIEAFYATNQIQLPNNRPEVLDLLSKKVASGQEPLLALLPSIAHFQTMQKQLEPKFKSAIYKARQLVHKLNAAMILQTLHQPTTPSIKMDELLIQKIPRIGSFDLPGAITGKKLAAFHFNKKKAPLTIKQFQQLEPFELRPLLYQA